MAVGKLDVIYETHKNKTWEKNGLTYKVIDRKFSKQMILEKHYSKKWNDGHFGYINIGIFKDNSECLGVATYGHLNNPKSALKLANGLTDIDQVLELNRMWIDDVLGKNTESQLISMSHKIIKELLPHVRIIQTFADGRLGVGTIYKASGFSYYGMTKTNFIRDTKTGEIYHRVNIDNYARPNGVVSVWKPIIDGTYESFSVNTYRYLFFLHRKVKKHCLLKEQPYPTYQKAELDWDFKLPTNDSTKEKLVKCFETKGEFEYLEKLKEMLKEK